MVPIDIEYVLAKRVSVNIIISRYDVMSFIRLLRIDLLKNYLIVNGFTRKIIS